jgi:hypothetical protein
MSITNDSRKGRPRTTAKLHAVVPGGKISGLADTQKIREYDYDDAASMVR